LPGAGVRFGLYRVLIVGDGRKRRDGASGHAYQKLSSEQQTSVLSTPGAVAALPRMDLYFKSTSHQNGKVRFNMGTSSMQETDLELLGSAAQKALAYLQNVRDRPVAPDAAAVRDLEQITGDLPEEGVEPWKLIENLNRIGSPATVATAGGRYFGFVIGRRATSGGGRQLVN
jgi:hypothetical protein